MENLKLSLEDILNLSDLLLSLRVHAENEITEISNLLETTTTDEFKEDLKTILTRWENKREASIYYEKLLKK